MAEIDRKKVMEDFQNQIAVGRADPQGITADLSMAVGVLLGSGWPGCAAAVAVLAEGVFPGLLSSYIGPHSEEKVD